VPEADSFFVMSVSVRETFFDEDVGKTNEERVLEGKLEPSRLTWRTYTPGLGDCQNFNEEYWQRLSIV